MAKIENPKTYTGRDLETIFFRPMLTGPDAAALGIKIMYNMPVPTTLQFWKRAGDILQKYTTSGWNGGSAASKYQKTIQLSKVKAEVGYSADDYFNMVYELITNRSDVNLDDLSGTELEAADFEAASHTCFLLRGAQYPLVNKVLHGTQAHGVQVAAYNFG